MALYVCKAWVDSTPEQIAEYLSQKFKTNVTRENVNHIVNVLRSKGVYIPHKRRNGIYQTLVDGLLEKNPELRKKK